MKSGENKIQKRQNERKRKQKQYARNGNKVTVAFDYAQQKYAREVAIRFSILFYNIRRTTHFYVEQFKQMPLHATKIYVLKSFFFLM